MRTPLRIAAALVARRTGERGPLPQRDAPTATPIRVLPPDSSIAGVLEAESTAADYTIRLLRDTVAGDKIAEVWQNGHRLWAVRAPDVRMEHVGRDLNGDRVPDAVIHIFTGGIHCCSQAMVLGLGDTLRSLGTIDGADRDVDFEDLDGDGISEVKIGDFRFAYWRDYSFAETPVPDVILAWRQGGYRPACDLMKEAAPRQATLRQRARELTAGWGDGDPPAPFWGYAVDLVYSGHSQTAWSFLESGWPDSIAGKREFLDELQERLAGSPCWSPPPRSRTTG